MKMRRIHAGFRSAIDFYLSSKNITLIAWLILFFIISRYAFEISKTDNPWQAGDWLINYEAGAVRRGLFGQILVYVADFGINLRWLTFLAQSSIYIIIYYLVIQIYLMRQRISTWLLFIFSPSFLFFPLFDSQGGFRKELLLFLSFSTILYFFAKKSLNVKTVFIAYMLYLISVFSHEMSAMALPFYLYVFYKSSRLGILQPRLAAAFSLLFFITAMSAVIFSMKFPGDAAISRGICESLVSRGLKSGICLGSIEWLQHDAQYGFKQVLWRLKLYVFYIPIFAISIAPVFLTNWARGSRLFLSIIGFIAFLPLYFVAIDWGRWIYIYVFLIFSLLLSESVSDEIEITPLPMWIIGIYLITWSIPHCCSNRPSFGWMELFFKTIQKWT